MIKIKTRLKFDIGLLLYGAAMLLFALLGWVSICAYDDASLLALTGMLSVSLTLYGKDLVFKSLDEMKLELEDQDEDEQQGKVGVAAQEDKRDWRPFFK